MATYKKVLTGVEIVINHSKQSLFEKFLTSYIIHQSILFLQNNANGTKLKDMIFEHNIVKSAVDYILQNSPEVKTLLP